MRDKGKRTPRDVRGMGSDGAELLGNALPGVIEGTPPRKPAKPPPDPAEVEGWLTGAEVTAIGVTPRSLSRWIESGIVQRAKDSAGQWRFKPEDIEAQKSRVLAPTGSRDEVLESFRALLHMTLGHLERSWSQAHDPGQKLLDLLAKENDRLAKRCEKLEDRHLQFLELFESLMTRQHERELAVKVTDQREARKDKAFTKLTDALPTFFQQVLSGLGAKRLVESIGDDQLAVLMLADFLTAEQKALLTAEQSRRAKVKAKADAESKKETASTEAKTEDEKA